MERLQRIAITLLLLCTGCQAGRSHEPYLEARSRLNHWRSVSWALDRCQPILGTWPMLQLSKAYDDRNIAAITQLLQWEVAGMRAKAYSQDEEVRAPELVLGGAADRVNCSRLSVAVAEGRHDLQPLQTDPELS